MHDFRYPIIKLSKSTFLFTDINYNIQIVYIDKCHNLANSGSQCPKTS